MFVKRSWPQFWIGAFICSPVFISMGAIILINCIRSDDMPTEALIVGIMILLIGIALLVAAIWTFAILHSHQAKLDKDVIVTYTITDKENSLALTSDIELYTAINNLADKENLTIKPSQVYGGLSLWKFEKNKNWIFSFVTVEKKNGKEAQYFVMPKKDAVEAAAPFVDLFRDKKSLDYSQLIDMKRYNAVLEYYKL